jgi:hypothetical protein
MTLGWFEPDRTKPPRERQSKERMKGLDIPTPYQRAGSQALKKAACSQEKHLNRKTFRPGLSGKLCEPENQVWIHVQNKHRHFIVTHHGIIDFSKALFRYLELPSVSPKHPNLGKDKRDNPK